MERIREAVKGETHRWPVATSLIYVCHRLDGRVLFINVVVVVTVLVLILISILEKLIDQQRRSEANDRRRTYPQNCKS